MRVQPDAVEQRKKEVRYDKTREAEESKDVVGPIRGEEKSSRRRSRGKKEPLPCFFEDTPGVEANGLGGDEPELAPENVLGGNYPLSLGKIGEDTGIERHPLEEASQDEAPAPAFSFEKLGGHPGDAAIKGVNSGDRLANDPGTATQNILDTHAEYYAPSDAHAHSGTRDVVQHPDVKGMTITDERDLNTGTGASELKEYMDESPDIGDNVTIEASADQKQDTVSTVQTELPSNEENHFTTNTPEPAKETVAEQDPTKNEPSASEDRDMVESLCPLEDLDLENELAFKSHTVSEIGSPALEESVARDYEFVAYGVDIKQPPSLAMPLANIYLEPVALDNSAVVASSSEASTFRAEHSTAEPPLLPHELYHAQDKTDDPAIEYNNRNMPGNWPFTTKDTKYGEALSEDSAWETVDEDERLEPSWGNVETPKDKHPPGADSKISHELSEDPGDKNVGEGIPRESTPPEIDLRDLHSSDFAHIEEFDVQAPEEEISRDIPRPENLEVPNQSSSLHWFAPNESLDEENVSDNQGQWVPEVASTKPLNDEFIHRVQSPGAVEVNKSQRQLALEDSTAWREPEAENLAGSEPTTFRHPQYFHTVSENSDDEFIVKKSDATEFVDGSLQIDSYTPDDSVSQDILVERFAQAGTSTRSPEQTTTLDETCLVGENDRRGWQSALEEEDDDTDVETHQLPHVFDYARFISELPGARPSRVVEETYSDEEFEEMPAQTETWRRNISHSGQGISITRGETEASQRARRNNFNWSPSSSSSLEQYDQGRFEPLLDDEHLGTIDVAFVPSQTLGVAPTQDQALEDAGISDLELASTNPSETQEFSVGLDFYGPQHDQSDELGPVAEMPIGPKKQRNNTQTDVYFEPPATAIGDALHIHGFTPQNDVRIGSFSSSREIQQSIPDGSSRDSELLEELPVVPALTIEHAGSEFKRQLLLARARASTNEDYGSRASQIDAIASTSFEFADPIHLGVDRDEDLSSLEKRLVPPKSIRRTRRPILVHSSTQTEQDLLHGSSRGSNRRLTDDPRSATPTIALPDLGDPNVKALGRARSLQKKRQQRFQEAEETVATAVVIYAAAQELSSPKIPCRGGDQFNENIIETFYATQGPAQVSSDSVPSGIATEYSDDESEFSPTVADLSTDDEDRDQHHRHRPHRSHHHSSRDKERKSGDEHHHHRRRHHRSGDDSKVSLKTSSDRSIPSRQKREDSRRHDSGHERSHDSEHRRRRTPEEQAAHDKRKEERRARRELEREPERERERDHKGKEAETTPPPDDRNSPRSSKRSGNSHSERHVTIKEEPSPVSSKRFFDFSRGESTLAATNVSSKPESHRTEAPKRSSPPTSTSKSHSSRPHREPSDAPRPRSSRHHDEAREDSSRPRSSRHHDEAREDSSRRHKERSSRPKVDDENKVSSRSMAESDGRHSTRSRADSDAKRSTRSRGDSDGRPSSSSHAKPRSSDVKEDRHEHSSRRAERQRERDAERKKKEAPTSGLKSVFKKLFA
ncbi:hypothetical protein F4782DRAFT_299502 [Xylaria castorea]|nr:hypothetical protein F4782DRAFT_299502 [Xylaria castorea]